MSRRRTALTSRVAVVAALVTAGCGRSSQDRADLDRVARAVDAVRDAPNDRKRPLLAALGATPCSAPGVCALRDQCVEAYELHLKATDAVDAVRRDLRRDAGTLEASARLLAQGEADLRSAAKETAACAHRQGELRRAFGLR